MLVDPAAVRIDCIICQGAESNDARRVVELMNTIGANYRLIYVDKTKPLLKRVLKVYGSLRESSSEFIFMEGTGVGGGLAVIALAFTRPSVKYLVSSGDAVDSFIRNQHGIFLGWVAGLYEQLLYRKSFAFVGWSPYLVGRAFRMGAKRGFTLEGAAPKGFTPAANELIASKRALLGIGETDLVIGVSGSLAWSDRQSYCYGMELANAAALVARSDVKFLVVGSGSGLTRIKEKFGSDPRFISVGRVAHEEMPVYIGLMSAAVISQTSDESGALRLTTKLPEYLVCGVPVAMPAIPGAMDYLRGADESAVWMLSTEHPASPRYAEAVASWINGLSLTDTEARRSTAIAIAHERFALERISGRLVEFLRTFRTDSAIALHKAQLHD